MAKEYIFMKEAMTNVCDIHDWERNVNTPRRLVQEMRAKHGNGGLNACVKCLHEIHAIAKQNAQK